MVWSSQYDSPLGSITLAGDDHALLGLWFDGQQHFGSTLPCQAVRGEPTCIRMAKRWLDIYFSGRQPTFTPTLHWKDTPFREAVWNQLLTIPYGSTVTYGRLAAQLGVGSARAVGGAVGRNPIALIVPCHRVVGADGSLTGYAGGVERKRALLSMEYAARRNAK